MSGSNSVNKVHHFMRLFDGVCAKEGGTCLPKSKMKLSLCRLPSRIESKVDFIVSADVFSTSTSCNLTLPGFVRPSFLQGQEKGTQSVRPYVQSSSFDFGRKRGKRGSEDMEHRG